MTVPILAVALRNWNRGSRWYDHSVATSTHTDELDELRTRIRRSLADIGQGEAGVDVGWLERTPEASEVLVTVTLPAPGEDGRWAYKTTSAIRTAVRTTTAEVMPWAVATTRLTSGAGDA